VMRQDPLVQHVGIRHHDVRLRPDGLPSILRRVAAVGEGGDVLAQRLDGRVARASPSGEATPGLGLKLGKLILSQRLGGEEVQRPRVVVLDDGVKDGQVVPRSAVTPRGDAPLSGNLGLADWTRNRPCLS
jgi:hypothetical protein